MKTPKIPEGYRRVKPSELDNLPDGAKQVMKGIPGDLWGTSSYIGKSVPKNYREEFIYIVPHNPAPKPSTDPKGEAGALKCPLWLIPPQAVEETAHVHALGAKKYGPFNWRSNKVCASTYISAIMRHLNAWRSGEDKDPESGRSHLAHIAANCFILMDAMAFGKLVDDRAK